MAYDSKTTTITLGEEPDFMADSGLFFVDVLRKEAARPGAPEALRKDWEILETWLGCAGRPLGPADNEEISAAWRSYCAVGVAPCKKLQPVFDSLHNRFKESGIGIGVNKPPTEVMDVFDRLLATDAEIRQKKQEDWDAERKNLEPLLRGLNGNQKPNWWRNKSGAFRKWVFLSFVWAVGVVFFVGIFDPFNNGAWTYMDDDEYLQMFTVMALPLLVGILVYMYNKFVK